MPMTETSRAADGGHTTNGTPHGATSLTPFLAIPDARGGSPNGPGSRTRRELTRTARPRREHRSARTGSSPELINLIWNRTPTHGVFSGLAAHVLGNPR